MRQLATLPPAHAELLADHLLTLGVETKPERLGEGVVVWVCDEDRLAEARAELGPFTHEPAAPRYAAAKARAAAIRAEREAADGEGEEDEDEEDEEGLPEPEPLARRPLTLALAVASVAVFLHLKPGDVKAADYDPGPVYAALQVNSDATRGDGVLADVRAGQAWRLFTPAVLHFDHGHVLVNLLALLYLGASVEGRLGPLRFALLVLGLAALSNVAEYALGGVRWGEPWARPVLHFGGLSGLLFGLTGYMRVKGNLDPEGGLSLPSFVWLMSLCSFLLCWTGAMGPIANVAHTAGLLVGMALALIPLPPREVLGDVPGDAKEGPTP